jgi:putative CocE/NonD family hydrolase
MTTGWYDLFSGAGDMFLWYANLTVPRRLLVRPADHSQVEKNQFDLDFEAEVHRWFDYWLKDIDNGIMKEPSIYYYVMGDSKNRAWRTSAQWPLGNEKLMTFYFAGGKTGSVASINDGFLRQQPPDQKDAADAYTVDYSTTSGKYSRWYAVNWPRDYPDMRSNDQKALTYTTLLLEADVEVTGHPVAHLWLTTKAPDLDVFVYLEEVEGSGKSTYLSEGNLRASHRKVGQAPYHNLGLPYHSHYQGDLEPIAVEKPVELVFSLLPISYRFNKGNRIRITVAFADADNFETPVIDPAPKLQLLRGIGHPSFIQLPIVQSQ